jgi:hypothetical protein
MAVAEPDSSTHSPAATTAVLKPDSVVAMSF